MKARDLLLDQSEVRAAMGTVADLTESRNQGAIGAMGPVISAAAADAAYRSFSGHLSTEEAPALAVAQMALIFAGAATAQATFDVVAQAAHLRTRVGESAVAVETVASHGGLVSYWGYLHRGAAIVVFTLDTVDPRTISMTSFRALVSAGADRLERHGSSDTSPG